MTAVGAVSTPRPTILVVISSNLPLPGRFALALRDSFSYESTTLKVPLIPSTSWSSTWFKS